MWKSDFVTPITSSNRNNSQLSKDNSTSNGSGNFLSAFNSKTNMTIAVSNNDESLESGSLTSTSLLLDRHDFHDFILEFSTQEPIDNLILLDGESKKVDFFEFTNQLFFN